MNYRLKQLIVNIEKFDNYFEYINRIIDIDHNNTKLQHFIKRYYDNKNSKIKKFQNQFNFNFRQRDSFFNKIIKLSRKVFAIKKITLLTQSLKKIK